MSALDTLSVVIPARNEEALVGACLRSVHASVEHARERSELPDIQILVVADSCTDSTAEIARAFSRTSVETVWFASVGAARARGVETSLARAGVDPRRHWLANTDADSIVPVNWIGEQLDHAAAGDRLVVGTVRPNPADLTRAQHAAWRQTHRRGHPNGHVHGANLGIRADAYLAAGGFPEQTEHEDNDLVRSLLALGIPAQASDRAEVVTSGRRYGRTPGGYAGYLRNHLVLHSLEPKAEECAS